MSAARCHGINTNSEDRPKRRKRGFPRYNVATAKKCHFFSPHLCLGMSKMKLFSCFFDINVISNEGFVTARTGEWQAMPRRCKRSE